MLKGDLFPGIKAGDPVALRRSWFGNDTIALVETVNPRSLIVSGRKYSRTTGTCLENEGRNRYNRTRIAPTEVPAK